MKKIERFVWKDCAGLVQIDFLPWNQGVRMNDGFELFEEAGMGDYIITTVCAASG